LTSSHNYGQIIRQQEEMKSQLKEIKSECLKRKIHALSMIEMDSQKVDNDDEMEISEDNETFDGILALRLKSLNSMMSLNQKR